MSIIFISIIVWGGSLKLISIVSSGRKNGNTERIVKNIEKEIMQLSKNQNIQLELEHINLAHSNIQLCKGCRICFNKGEALCPAKDDLLMINDKINQADGIILASPVYVEDVNGVMKNWIDRMAFNCHRPAFAGKTALIVTTSGIGSSKHALRTMNSALQPWGFHVASQIKFRTGALMEDKQITSLYAKQIKIASYKLFTDLYGCKSKVPSFYSLMAFKVQQSYWHKYKGEHEPLDYSYWKVRGWTEKNCDYYIQHNANIVKVALARLSGRFVSIFFI